MRRIERLAQTVGLAGSILGAIASLVVMLLGPSQANGWTFSFLAFGFLILYALAFFLVKRQWRKLLSALLFLLIPFNAVTSASVSAFMEPGTVLLMLSAALFWMTNREAALVRYSMVALFGVPATLILALMLFGLASRGFRL